jgi:hypothetical protein
VATVPKPKSRKSSRAVVLPVGDPDTPTVRAFMLECLVPLLAEEFLKRRDAALSQSFSAIPRKPSFGPLGEEGGL